MLDNIYKIRIILWLGLFFVLPSYCVAFSPDSLWIQTTDTLLVEEEDPFLPIFTFVEPTPEFPGGTAELEKFFSKNIKYPPAAQEAGIEGDAICRFTITQDGSIADIKIIESSSNLFNKEIVRVMKKMPKWNPGNARGIRKKMHIKIPFVFKLTD
ncbi:MAG: energy transducer TonB [Tannerellaceae bacterium]|nr:energy transducer TonB [Tannerellaceae bacterium]